MIATFLSKAYNHKKGDEKYDQKLTYQSWAGDVPNWSLGGFMTDGSGSFNTGWRNRGQGILRLL